MDFSKTQKITTHQPNQMKGSVGSKTPLKEVLALSDNLTLKTHLWATLDLVMEGLETSANQINFQLAIPPLLLMLLC